jgi:hypothetical protein
MDTALIPFSGGDCLPHWVWLVAQEVTSHCCDRVCGLCLQDLMPAMIENETGASALAARHTGALIYHLIAQMIACAVCAGISDNDRDSNPLSLFLPLSPSPLATSSRADSCCCGHCSHAATWGHSEPAPAAVRRKLPRSALQQRCCRNRRLQRTQLAKGRRSRRGIMCSEESMPQSP